MGNQLSITRARVQNACLPNGSGFTELTRLYNMCAHACMCVCVCDFDSENIPVCVCTRERAYTSWLKFAKLISVSVCARDRQEWIGEIYKF